MTTTTPAPTPTPADPDYDVELLTAPNLVRSVQKVFEVTWEDLCGRSRKSRHSTPRKVLGYLLRENTRLTLQDIGDMLGGRDHTTVMFWVHKVRDDIASSPVLRNMVELVRVEASRLLAANWEQ